MIQHRLQRKKVLLILDDVDKLEQLLPLALEVIGSNLFGKNTRRTKICHQTI